MKLLLVLIALVVVCHCQNEKPKDDPNINRRFMIHETPNLEELESMKRSNVDETPNINERSVLKETPNIRKQESDKEERSDDSDIDTEDSPDMEEDSNIDERSTDMEEDSDIDERSTDMEDDSDMDEESDAEERTERSDMEEPGVGEDDEPAPEEVPPPPVIDPMLSTCNEVVCETCRKDCGEGPNKAECIVKCNNTDCIGCPPPALGNKK